jgi:hypothetical protein
MLAKSKTPHALRMAVWRTYASDTYIVAKCFCCRSHEISMDNFECGHVKSERNGGAATLDNMRPICGACNKSMGTQDMFEFINQYALHAHPVSLAPAHPVSLAPYAHPVSLAPYAHPMPRAPQPRSDAPIADDAAALGVELVAALFGPVFANPGAGDIHQGMPDYLKTKIILKHMETPLYHHGDGDMYILLTNLRFIKLEHHMIVNEVFLANIQSVAHVGGGVFHWDKVKIVETSTKVQMVGIRRKNTCLGFINLLRQLTNCH